MADLSLVTLDKIAQRITSTLDLGEVLESITAALVDDIGTALARIWLVEGDSLVLRASSGISTRLAGPHARVPRDDARKIAVIARTAEALCTNDLGNDPRIVDPGWVAREGIRSFAGHPLVFRGKTLGVLASFSRHALGDAEIEGLALLARWAAIAVHNAQSFTDVATENADLRGERPNEILGAGLEDVRESIVRVARTDSTVLLLGETGTGKELFARAIHERSTRRARTLVKVNCAAVPATLVESELFGHEKGAFTGADRRRVGRFELASGGTLFLDEVGELPLEAQPKLLRALQEREIERLGTSGSAPIPIDVRVVAATHRDLESDVKSGRFRADLFFRLNVFPIVIPPLRARRRDIPVLAEAFLKQHGKRLGRTLSFTPAAMRALEGYDWPGNVRELQNVVERAAILANGDEVDVASLPTFAPAPEKDLTAVERAHVARVLDDHQWKIEGPRGAAAALGLKPSTLRSRIEKLGIRRPR